MTLNPPLTAEERGCGTANMSAALGNADSGHKGRFVDTPASDDGMNNTASFSPLQFTVDPALSWESDASVQVPLLRPTLISPATPRENQLTAVATRNAPALPLMENLKSNPSHSGTKLNKSCASFLPYKKRAFPPSAHFFAARPEKSDAQAASILLQLRCSGSKGALSVTGTSTASSQGPQIMAPTSISSPRKSSAAGKKKQVQKRSKAIAKSKGKSRRTVTPAPSSGLRLALPNDLHELNSLHCFVRSELLEIFVLPVPSTASQVHHHPSHDSSATTPGGGRVGLRCVYCAHLPRSQRIGSTMSTFYPKNLNDIYRSVCTWQRLHFRTCRHIPPKVRETYWQLKENDRTRGKTRYWVSSAQRLGLADVDGERGGIYFARSINQRNGAAP